MAFPSVRVQAKGQVTIPQPIREKWQLKPGDLVVFEETPAGVVIKPAQVVTDENLRTALAQQMTALQARFADLAPEEVDELVEAAVQWARQKHA